MDTGTALREAMAMNNKKGEEVSRDAPFVRMQ